MAIGGIAGKALGGLTGPLKSLWNDLTGNQIELFFKDNEQASFDLGQKTNFFLENHPRLKFQYFAKIKFNEILDANNKLFVNRFLGEDEIAMLVPLTSAVDMPGMKVDTKKLNQYNHTRFAQTKIQFDPVTMEMYDVADGKTLRFWEMYYEYYFRDSLLYETNRFVTETTGFEEDTSRGKFMSFLIGKKPPKLVKGSTDYARKLPFNFTSDNVGFSSILNSSENDVIGLNYSNNFGYSLNENKHLIDYIEIYQYHANRWSMVRLVKPVISSFKHDRLDFSESEPVKMTYTFEYEYAIYHNFATPFAYDTPKTGFKAFFTGGVDKAEDEPTGASVYFKNSNYLEKEGLERDFSNFKVSDRGTPATKMTPEAGKLRDNSLLGNLMTDIKDVISGGPDKIGDSVTGFAATGKWVQPFDGNAIGKGLSSKASTGVKTISTKNLGSAAKGTTGSVFDVRRK